MDLEPVRIVADDREKVGGVVAELGRRPDVSLEVRRLEIGDYVVANAVVVERKTIGDFAASVIDARLFRQAGALIQAKLRPALVLEGSSGGIRDRVTLSREAMQGALITVSLFYGLAILRARDPAETAWLLVCLGRQARRFARGGLPRPGCRPKGKRARQIFLLQGLPGIGPERADRLLARFGSIRAVALASATALGEVESIGAATAAKIRWAID